MSCSKVKEIARRAEKQLMVVNALHSSNVPRPVVRSGVLYAGLALCFAAFAICHWVFWPVKISGQSMWPNYRDGQPNYINKLAYLTRSPERGDVVGVRINANEVYLKRIIGLPGERIDFHRGTVVVNGKPLVEPYVERTLLWWLKPVQLGPQEYFVMGDNRQISVLGPVAKQHIIGRAVY